MVKWTYDEIIKTYEAAANDIAQMVSRLAEYKGKFDLISDFTMDNMDPVCDAGDALEKMGILLSSVVIYANEYKESKEKGEPLGKRETPEDETKGEENEQ